MTSTERSPFRWGILGTGPVAQKFAIGLRSLGGAAEATVVASRQPANAQRAAAALGIPRVAASYADAVVDVDAVYVATPPTSHLEHALLAIGAGVPVLVEKPFAADAASGRQIVAAARRADVFCMEAMWTRFLPLLDLVRQHVRDGDLGELRGLDGSFCVATRYDPAASIFDPTRGGGALLHRAVYPLSLARHLLGPVAASHAVALLGESGVDEDVALVARHAGGAVSTVRASLRSAEPSALTLRGTRATLRVDPPVYRPHAATLTPVEPTAQGSAGRLGHHRERPAVQAAQQWTAPLRRMLSRGARVRAHHDGNGYHYQAAAVAAAVREGAIECPTMPLDESIEVLDLLDHARATCGDRDAA